MRYAANQVITLGYIRNCEQQLQSFVKVGRVNGIEKTIYGIQNHTRTREVRRIEYLHFTCFPSEYFATTYRPKEN
jgi:hypothetical protein